MDLRNEINDEARKLVTRRWFFKECGVGLGSIALASLIGKTNPARAAQAFAPANPLAPRMGHFAPKAKRVIYLFQAGAPSHLDLFDYKPELAKRNGQLPPADLLKGYRAAFINPNSALLGPKYKFNRYGKCGAEMSELLPNIGSVADDICIIRTMQTDAVNHAPGQIMMNTGSQQFGRPSLGAWSVYGLGSDSQVLPGYVVLSSANGTSGGSSNWGPGFLPTSYGGVPFRSGGDPVLYLSNPKGLDDSAQRASLETLRRLNEMQLADAGDPEIAARIQSYEMGYKMQSSAPELMDLKQEKPETLAMYGVADVTKHSFGRNCLIARRLVERGVRFVQLFHEAWDQHADLTNKVKANCAETDQPAAALVKDL